MAGLLAVILAVTLIFVFVVRRKTKSKPKPENAETGFKEQDLESPEDVPEVTDEVLPELETGPKPNPPPPIEPRLPDHIVLQKDDNLKNKLKELASQPEVLTREYSVLKQFVHEHIKKEVTVARLPANKIHNRYTDNGREIIIIF